MGLAAVRQARVHAGVGDVAIITGRERPGRGLDRIAGFVLPRTTAQVADPIPGEEVLEIDGERVVALPVPGHSLGSFAYLARGVLFVGDAASIEHGRLVPGPRFLSSDPASVERALVRLAGRALDLGGVTRVCTGHGGCSEPGDAERLLREVAGR
jgi:glyoxylase-like metal-dependent hydrolase (beta-lactamase superfamily II)